MIAGFALGAWVLSGAPPLEDTWLQWRAPSDCPDAAAVAGRIARLAGPVTSSDDPSVAPGLHVVGEVTRNGQGYRLQLRVTQGEQIDVRTLDADRCETLAEAAALVASVGWDPVATVQALELPAPDDGGLLPDPLDSPSVTQEPRGSVAGGGRSPARGTVATDRPPSRERPRRDRSVGLWLRARGGVGVAVVPHADAIVDLALAVGTARVRGELLGAWASPRSRGVGADGLRVQLGSVTPRICATVPQGRVDLVACGGVALGAMRGVRGTAARVVPWIAAHADVGLRIVITPRLSAWVSAVVELPLRYPRFVIHAADDPRDTRELFRPSVASLRGLAGLEIRLRGLDKRQ